MKCLLTILVSALMIGVGSAGQCSVARAEANLKEPHVTNDLHSKWHGVNRLAKLTERCVLKYGRYEVFRKNPSTQRVEVDRRVNENGTITVSARPIKLELRSENQDAVEVFSYDEVTKVSGVGHFLTWQTAPGEPAFGFVPELRAVSLVRESEGRGYYVDADGADCLSRLLSSIATVR